MGVPLGGRALLEKQAEWAARPRVASPAEIVEATGKSFDDVLENQICPNSFRFRPGYSRFALTEGVNARLELERQDRVTRTRRVYARLSPGHGEVESRFIIPAIQAEFSVGARDARNILHQAGLSVIRRRADWGRSACFWVRIVE